MIHSFTLQLYSGDFDISQLFPLQTLGFSLYVDHSRNCSSAACLTGSMNASPAEAYTS
eukprot:m.68898 g.68898  ORF g.68898 m.68898 type:complete len:58 (-) comp14099_c0_seq6:1187-1360(-)